MHACRKTGQTVDALLTSADQARQTREQAQLASAALETIAQSVSGIDERNLVIASAAEEQVQVAREVDRTSYEFAICRCKRRQAPSKHGRLANSCRNCRWSSTGRFVDSACDHDRLSQARPRS
ncbi:methyl-accepting chemotaxis sensory transducer [Pseudomonas psychrotolerans L19]|nr:methyl-accepting chemotaxis sensory transducer [Pseudomonas psychrotolerans L19]